MFQVSKQKPIVRSSIQMQEKQLECGDCLVCWFESINILQLFVFIRISLFICILMNHNEFSINSLTFAQWHEVVCVCPFEMEIFYCSANFKLISTKSESNSYIYFSKYVVVLFHFYDTLWLLIQMYVCTTLPPIRANHSVSDFGTVSYEILVKQHQSNKSTKRKLLNAKVQP